MENRDFQSEITHSKSVLFDTDMYPSLSKYAAPMLPASRPVLGREHEIRRLLTSLNRPELSNALLLGDAGSGKTMLVQGTLERDVHRVYIEVDLARMASSDHGEDGATQMASRIKALFDEAIAFKTQNQQMVREGAEEKELVLFIDEVHLLPQLSPAAAQAIKPILAESGRRGIKIIAATTFAEFHEFIEPDQALMQRLQRINIHEPSKDTVVAILSSVAVSHNVAGFVYDDQLYDLIYEYSRRYIPADSQPRKSILLLDSMIGWFRTFPGEYKMNRHLLADVIYDSTGVKVTFQVDGRAIEEELNKYVFSQQRAMKVIEQRLQIAVADLHDKKRPISSFLFTGATGVGKTETVKALAKLLFNDDKSMIRFDMSEYALSSSLERFREELTDRVWNKSHSIILLDEIEKAHSSITRLLLQVLDDGRLTNARGREVGFLNTYIVMTTNVASEIYKTLAHYDPSDTGSEGLEKHQKVIRASIMNDEKFAPEIVNRMNAIVPFQPLSRETYLKITNAKIESFIKLVHTTHGVKLYVDKKVPEYFVYEIFDVDTDSGGARGLVSHIDDLLISKVARFINTFPDVKSIGASVEGKLAYLDENIRESEAYIEVGYYNDKEAARLKELQLKERIAQQTSFKHEVHAKADVLPKRQTPTQVLPRRS